MRKSEGAENVSYFRLRSFIVVDNNMFSVAFFGRSFINKSHCSYEEVNQIVCVANLKTRI